MAASVPPSLLEARRYLKQHFEAPDDVHVSIVIDDEHDALAIRALWIGVDCVYARDRALVHAEELWDRSHSDGLTLIHERANELVKKMLAQGKAGAQ